MCYLGIPYAKPPVDNLRWKAPEPLPASEAVFEAKNFGASAIQVEYKGSIIKHHRQSEDCLTLNIGVGIDKTESQKPVLVLFHSGDFTCGGSVDPLMYGGDFTASHPDIVFVSFNYRLGIFGFIDFSEIPGGDTRPDTTNLGLYDQIAALKWIKENIAAFGGDPDRITVLGFESGATSILLLAASGQAKGLFQRAFVFNGSPVSAYNTPEASRTLAKDLLKETQTMTMAELLQLDTETLKDAAQRLWQNMCAPTCDGKLIPVDVYQALRDGAASDVEFIIGIPSNETQAFKSLVGGQRYMDGIISALADMRSAMDDATADAVRAYFEAQTAASTELEAKSKLVEQWLALCIYRTAARLHEGGNRVHLMYWAEKPLIENLGSGTADAAATLLGNEDALQMYGSVMNADLSETLQTLLQKFIIGKALEMYVNVIYFGNGVYGIAEAARFYFDKPVADLDLNQMVMLAVIPSAPTICNPIQHPEAFEHMRNRFLVRFTEGDRPLIAPAEVTAILSHDATCLDAELRKPDDFTRSYPQTIPMTNERFGPFHDEKA